MTSFHAEITAINTQSLTDHVDAHSSFNFVFTSLAPTISTKVVHVNVLFSWE